MPGILIVDDSPAIRRSLRSLIAEQPEWTICGEAENGKIGVEMTRQLSPDVVILDLSMPVMNGLDAARRIKEMAPRVHILLFTLHASPQLLEYARNAGINQVISKSGDTSSLLTALRSLQDS